MTTLGSGHASVIRTTPDPLRWLADDGGLLWPVVRPFDPAAVDSAAPGIWRYRAALDVDPDAAALTLGEGGTPLIEARLDGAAVHFKLDFLQPTGSYKDRGFAALFTVLRHAGVRSVVEDSSGNAGASAAAYGAASGIAVTLCLPADAGGGVRIAQALAFGATIDRTAPTRAAAAERARRMADAGAVYASHVYHPAYLAGQQTIAFEIWRQLGRAPDDVVVPLGHGGLLLGLALGFQALLDGGCIDRRPRLHGVQAAAQAPIATAFAHGAARPTPFVDRTDPAAPTIAAGIAITDPPRGAAVLAAVRRSGGTVRAVDEATIRAGQAALASLGWLVEPTSAVVASTATALARSGGPGARVVAVLTGSGLKDGLSHAAVPVDVTPRVAESREHDRKG
ncbi:MAG: pyridoxal-phosphate dependent enzyme [Ardenticatenales bacterium]|nr:pyridoxal-phosphate dependent enzyme [Ardenticatenales bacterium]